MAKGKTIYSIEDPIEVVQDNIVQLEVNEKIGFGYDEGIKQILRHNPDIIMIGEIRDSNTACMCVRAALTGCLVVSSLHARNTSSAISRMVELGVKQSDLTECAVGIVNQRLVRLKNNKGYSCVYDILQGPRLEACFTDRGSYREQMSEKIRMAVRDGIIEDEEGTY